MTRATEAGTILGTVGYMSPEQASGEPADFRSDQFSLGSILYEMATGRRAFERPTDAQTLSAIIESEPEPLAAAAPKVPTSLAWIVERCLAKDPEDRYGSTKDLARDLAALRDQSSGVSVLGVAPPPASATPALARRALAARLGAAGIAVLAFLAGQRSQARRDRERASAEAHDADVPAGLSDRRPLRSRRADDRVLGVPGTGSRSEIFTTRVGSTESRPLGIENAAHPGGLVDRARWRSRSTATRPWESLHGNARPSAARGRSAARDPR